MQRQNATGHSADIIGMCIAIARWTGCYSVGCGRPDGTSLKQFDFGNQSNRPECCLSTAGKFIYIYMSIDSYLKNILMIIYI